MTVGELIEKLKEFPEDLKVINEDIKEVGAVHYTIKNGEMLIWIW